MISKCTICERYSNANTKEPLLSHKIPEVPFAKVASDILQFREENYLVLQDYYSKWLEIIKLKNKTGSEVIKKLKTVFATHGIPDILICDNRPYNSYEFKEFSKKWLFKIVTSSPNYPRSNGLAERAVQTAKKILEKTRQENIEMEIALLEYRNMPIPGLDVSPAQIMFNRRVKTKVPVHVKLLQPAVPQNVHKKLVENQVRAKNYHDLHAKKREDFREGENVLVKTGKVWEPARIVSKHDTPRSYMIINNKGNIVGRNSSHLKKTKTEPIFGMYDEDIEENVEEDKNNRNEKMSVRCNEFRGSKTTRSG
ncbi:Uncharacterized protein K02A2.6 [Trachymyrmex cornetzi]|uniref:Uncharacterized protein K02A2.6 n=1 Tax=Trachymyrmex cornetzi TaxID=471704 RepID=A0A151J814_9HYME|nr:Uncharacterized protein K02A2.6 [Trachymyrmex cornetzi]